MKELIEILEKSQASCVIQNNGEIKQFFKPGVADLYELTQTNPEILHGANIADKVVGKAAAALMINGKIKEVYARLISKSACKLFEKANIKVTYAQCVEHIYNRSKSDICPLEKLCIDTNDISQILDNVETFIASIRNN